MKQEEKIYYEKIKSNPKDILFDQLFIQNPDGSVNPKQGVTFKLIGGIPYIEDFTPLQPLFAQGFLSTKATLQDLYVSGADIEEQSRQFALNSPLGEKSIFYPKPGNPQENWWTGEKFLKYHITGIRIPGNENVYFSTPDISSISNKEDPNFIAKDHILSMRFVYSDIGFDFLENINFKHNTFDQTIENVKDIAKEIIDGKLNKYGQYGLEKLRAYWNNFFWLLESNPSEICFIHFVKMNRQEVDGQKVVVPEIQKILVDIGSDVFDRLRLDDAEVYQKNFSDDIINSNSTLVKFKNDLEKEYRDFFDKVIYEKRFENFINENNVITGENPMNRVIDSYWGKENLLIRPELTQPFPKDQLLDAVNAELQAEFNFLSSADTYFSVLKTFSTLIGINLAEITKLTETFTHFLEGKRLGEEHYVPSHPNFSPLFGEEIQKALKLDKKPGKLPDWIKDALKIKYDEDVNIVYINNAMLCGLLNGLNDFITSLTGQPSFFRDIFTDRIFFKQFFRGIENIFSNFSDFLDNLLQLGEEAYLGSIYKIVYHIVYDSLLVLSFYIPGVNVLKAVKGLKLVNWVVGFIFDLLNSKLLKSVMKLGLKIEKIGGELVLKTANGTIVQRVKAGKALEKLIKELEEIQKKFPKFEFPIKPIVEHDLEKLIGLRKLAGKLNRKLTKTLKGCNIATAKIKILLKDGTLIEKKLMANAGEINRLQNGAKNLDKAIHKESHFYDPLNKRPRLNDSELKIIISEIEENLMKNMDLSGAKIELEINSILKPCPVCSRELKRFEKLYNAKVTVHSTEYEKMRLFENAYPRYK